MRQTKCQGVITWRITHTHIQDTHTHIQPYMITSGRKHLYLFICHLSNRCVSPSPLSPSLSSCLSVCLSLPLSVSIYLSIRLFVCLSFSLSRYVFSVSSPSHSVLIRFSLNSQRTALLSPSYFFAYLSICQPTF